MKKLLFALVFSMFFVAGCSLDSEPFVLDDEYYSKGEFIEIKSSDFEKLTSQNYILYTYNNFCALAIPCEDIFKEFMDKYKIDFISMKFDEFKNIELHKTVEFAPSVIIVKNGKVVDYLDSEKDEDLEKFQDVEAFADWIKKYVVIEK